MSNNTIIKVDSVYLYTGDDIKYVYDEKSNTNILTGESKDSVSIKTWLSNNSIQYTLLNYNDISQHEQVLSAVNTWFVDTPVNTFPFIVYDEVDVDYNRKRNILLTANTILNSDLPNLIKLYG